MSRRRLPTALLALALSSTAAPLLRADDAKPGDAEKVKTALAKWAELKKAHGGNYEYTVSFQSFVGFGHTTTIVVRDNKVTERRFKTFNRRDPNAGSEGWTETGKEIGTHKKQAAPAVTLDVLYADAAKVAQQKLPPHLRRYVRTNKQGLLTSCFTVDTRIADDAPTKGLRVGSIKLGKGEK